MSPPPPHTGRVVWLLLKVGAMRWRNRVLSRLWARRRKDPATRRPTARKGKKWNLLTGLMGALMFFTALMLAWTLMWRIAEQSDRRERHGRMPVSRLLYNDMRRWQQSWAKIRKRAARGLETRKQLEKELKMTVPPLDANGLADSAEDRRKAVLIGSNPHMLGSEARSLAGPYGDADAIESRVRSLYIEKGIGAFEPIERRAFLVLPGRHLWARPDREGAVLRTLGILLTGLILMLLFKAFGAGNLDLKGSQWSMEWLMTFPVRARGVFLARLLQVAVLNDFGWLTVFSLLVMVYWSAGFGPAGVLAALGVTACVNLVLAAAQVSGETWLRKHLTRSRLNNVVGVCTILQMLFFVGTMAVAMTPPAVGWLVDLADSLPAGLLWLPTFIPLLLCRWGPAAWVAGGVLLVAAVALPALAARSCQRMVRHGLVAQSATYEARRAPARLDRRGAGGGLVRGMLGKELLLLRRDRTFLAQAVVLPILLCLLQVVINPHLFKEAAESFQHATAAAFGTGGYILLISGSLLLTTEIRGLWLLYTFPHRLEKLLIRKIAIWSAVGVVFAAVLLAVFSRGHTRWSLDDAVNTVIALAGVGITGLVCSGICFLNTDIQAEKPRPASGAVFLNMLLLVAYISAIYVPGLWQKAVILGLFILVACAIWQKVRDHIPYLLDPTAKPPPALSLADGLIAAFVFVVVQSILFVVLQELTLETLDLLAVTYALAGAVVAPVSLLIFWRRKVPGLLAAVGLTRPPGAGRKVSWRGAALRGVAWGLAAGAVGSVYLQLIQRLGLLRWLQELTPFFSPSHTDHPLWIITVAVLAAPIVEEYLFRGLVYQGLARSTRPWLAIVGSALLFAMVHSPAAVVPVFVLGVIAAVSFRRTGLILTPVLAHATYNLVVMTAGYLVR